MLPYRRLAVGPCLVPAELACPLTGRTRRWRLVSPASGLHVSSSTQPLFGGYATG